jgi:hypothetical protein
MAKTFGGFYIGKLGQGFFVFMIGF